MRRNTSAAFVLSSLAAVLVAGLSGPLPAEAAPTTATTNQPAATSKLAAVSASSATDAWAVGHRTAPGENTLALTRHWNGQTWTTVASVHPSEYSFLWGVTDLSPTDAWAVGEWIGEATIQPFVEHWDGSTWQLVPLHGAPGLGKLTAISAVGPDDIWMVGTGYANPGQTARTFIEHWDGTAIHRVRAGKLLHARSSELTGITAAGPDDVWAVGTHGRQGQLYLPLLEHFDGTSWTVVSTDLAPKALGHFSGVSASTASDAWAVGWEGLEGQPSFSALVEHWDGTTWTHSAALTPAYASFLTGVSAVSGDDVWAVGYSLSSDHGATGRPLIEHWDGAAWSIVHAPARHHADSELASVSMAGPADGFAVGDTTVDGHTTSYTVRWDGEVWGR